MRTDCDQTPVFCSAGLLPNAFHFLLLQKEWFSRAA
jgi:hypothetical protein